jgi:hypothetical protein
MGHVNLRNIPHIMRVNGFHNGAKLMDTWFSRPAAIAPRYSDPVTNVIQMDSWVLTFTRAKLVYDQIFEEKIWSNPKALNVVRSTLQRRGVLTNAEVCYQPPTTSITALTVDKVGVYVWDTFDFNGSQSLGYWNDETNTVRRHSFYGDTHVRNYDFCVWRSVMRRGGDFLVISDVKWTTLPTPDVFLL